MKYIVEQKEVWIQRYEVEGESEQEAIIEANDGYGKEIGAAQYESLLSDYTEIDLAVYEADELEVEPISKWQQNELQFPRLLSEIQANVAFSEEQASQLCESMDLSWSEIMEIFERAIVEFDSIKESL